MTSSTASRRILKSAEVAAAVKAAADLVSSSVVSSSVAVPPGREPRWVSLRVAAAHAKVAPKTVRAWIDAGLLPGYRFGPRVLRVDLDDIDRLVARRIPASEGEAS